MTITLEVTKAEADALLIFARAVEQLLETPASIAKREHVRASLRSCDDLLLKFAVERWNAVGKAAR